MDLTMNNSLEMTDLERCAYFLCSGAELMEVRFKEDAKKKVSFLVEGKDIAKLDADYINGRARVNPLQYKEFMNYLRDRISTTLRDGKGRTRHDRQRKDRKYKANR